ncbi:MAG: hypothetical protein ACRDS0_19980 [Pseudonocardiaceae bacterium]
MAAGVGEIPGAQLNVRHQPQGGCLSHQVACFARPGEDVRHAMAGRGKVAGFDQGFDEEGRPGKPRGPAQFSGSEDALRLPGPVQRGGGIAGIARGAAERRQGEDLAGGIADLAGRVQGLPGVAHRLRYPAEEHHGPGPAGQQIGQQRRRRLGREYLIGSGLVGERGGRGPDIPEPELRQAPLPAAVRGLPGRGEQHFTRRIPGAAHMPPAGHGHGQAQRHIRVMLQGPRHRLMD